jgi:integrase
MASVEDRWHRPVRDDKGKVLIDPDTRKPVLERTDRYGIGRRWLLRWRDPDLREHKLSFAKKVQADNKKTEIEAELLKGTYLDPKAGEVTFGAYATEWMANLTTDVTTREGIEGNIGRHVEGTTLWGARLRNVRPSTVQGWIKSLSSRLSESTKAQIYGHVVAILNAAVDDEKIGKNPATASSVNAPKPDKKEITPWPAEWVAKMHGALPERYKPFVTLGAGLGLRQGEMFGLSPDDIDWLRGWVNVERQVKVVANKLVFSLPKGRKTRKVPLPDSVRDQLAAYLVTHPAATVELPWEDLDGDPVAVRLMVTYGAESKACHRNNFGNSTWRPALTKAGIPLHRDNGCHALRHRYAAVLLDASENIKAVAKWLGHSSPTITLDYYGHLLPASEDRTRAAIDKAVQSWGAPVVPQQAREG